MGKVVSGVFNGTGAAVYVCLGFVPDYVRVASVTSSVFANIEWNINMRLAAAVEGVLDTNGNTNLAEQVYGAGIAPYYGGDLMTTTNQTSVANGEGVYLWWDKKDYRAMSNANVNPGDMEDAYLTTFTMDTPANRTGHFNTDVVGTYCGIGSKIIIGGTAYRILALTAGQGISADEVTLSAPLSSAPLTMAGQVGYISNKYDMIPIPIGKVSTAGFVVNMATPVNVNDEVQMFVAGTFDN